MTLVATRYAESLFSLAVDLKLVNEYKEQISFINDSFNEVDVKSFFASSRINKDEKKRLCEKAFKDNIDKYILNFLYVLIDKNRMIYYEEIFDEFINLCNEYLHIDVGVVEVAHDIDQNLLNELEDALSNKDKKIELKIKTNKELISGFKITIKNRIIDNSMKNRIDELQEALLKKGGA